MYVNVMLGNITFSILHKLVSLAYAKFYLYLQ